jgi:hypothetical protein
MSARAASWLAWSLCLLGVTMLAAGVVLLLLNGPSAGGTGTWGTMNNTFIYPVVVLVFTLVGALIASRLPGNSVGWISLAIGFALGRRSQSTKNPGGVVTLFGGNYPEPELAVHRVDLIARQAVEGLGNRGGKGSQSGFAILF